MNTRLLAWAAEASSGMHLHHQIVLIRLAALADKNGVYRGGQPALAAAAGVSKDVVKRVMPILDELGFIVRETTHRANGHRGSDRVRLTTNQGAVSTLVGPGPKRSQHPSQGCGKHLGPKRSQHPPIEDTLKGGDRDQQFSRRAEDEGNDNAPPDGPVKPGPRLTLHRGGKAA